MKYIMIAIIAISNIMLNAFFSDAQAQEVQEQQMKEFRVVAVLPLSGPNASLGKNMLGAIQLAIKDLKANDFELVAVDSEMTSAQIVEKLDALNPNAILGPAHSSDTKKLLPYLRNSNTCVISFSNDRDLANKDCLALLGFMPEESIKKVTVYASSNGYKIYALLPNNRYGKLVGSFLQSYHNLGFIKLADIELYDPEKHETVNASIEAMNNRINEEIDPSKTAILIPENSVLHKTLGLVNGKSKLIGSSQWEDNRLYSEQRLQGGWFATAPTKYRDRFEDRFRLNYDAKPLKISALAYDSMAFVYSILSSNDDGKVTKNHLIDPSGFIGITGMFRFLSDGTNERVLSVFEIRDGKIVEVDSSGTPE